MNKQARNSINITSSYMLAQRAIADLKTAILQVIVEGPEGGLTNAELGRTLGIYGGHVGHEGHISRTLLSMLENEGVIQQDHKSKKWTIRRHTASKS